MAVLDAFMAISKDLNLKFSQGSMPLDPPSLLTLTSSHYAPIPPPPPSPHTHTLENLLHGHRPLILQFQITRPPTIFHRTLSWLVHMNIWNKFTLFLCFQWNWACTCSGLQQTPKSTSICWEGKHKNLDTKQDNITSIKAWEKHYITIKIMVSDIIELS